MKKKRRIHILGGLFIICMSETAQKQKNTPLCMQIFSGPISDFPCKKSERMIESTMNREKK